MQKLIWDDSRNSFQEWSKDIDPIFEQRLADFESAIRRRLSRWPKSADYLGPADFGTRVFEKIFFNTSRVEKAKLQICICSRLALKLPAILQREHLPDGILNCYPSALQRMESDLSKNLLNAEFRPLTKYIRFLSALTVPCGAQVLDLKSCIPFSSALLSVPRMRDIRPLIKYMSRGGFGTWFRPHTDGDYLEEFNQVGFDQYYMRVADLLRRRHQVRGVVATSWFNDPRLAEISPRLEYLVSHPISCGAFYIRHSMTDFDIDSATRTSPTRRKLFEEGKYRPTAYSLIWPRDELLDWASGK